MGQIDIITKEQSLLLDEFKNDPTLANTFYFSGGTALSLCYLQHRQSIDLDFFSLQEFDPQLVLTKLTNWQSKLKFKLKYTPLDINHIFNLTFQNNASVKVDFVFYPYKTLKPHQSFEGIQVDSLQDIGTNKLLMIEQRTEVKDFVDLFFILEKFTIWDLLAGVKPKFKLELDNLVLASDLLKVEDFDYLPEMIKPLEINTLKKFFRIQAKSLGLKSVES